jgi:ABC-2 type transport system ATP-binding protein
LIESLPERTGCAILLSSHLLHDVERVCSRAVLLHQGEVVYSGSIEELRKEGQKDIYEVRVKTGEDKLARALKAKGCTVELDAGVLAVHVPAAEKQPTDFIFTVAEGEGLQVRHLQPKRLTLESAFVRAVQDAKEARA